MKRKKKVIPIFDFFLNKPQLVKYDKATWLQINYTISNTHVDKYGAQNNAHNTQKTFQYKNLTIFSQQKLYSNHKQGSAHGCHGRKCTFKQAQ